MLRIRLIALLTCLALFAPSLVYAAGPIPPEQLARQTVQKVLNDLDGKREELRKHPQQLYALIKRDLLPLIDTKYMSQLVLGRYWREATPEQRKRFETAFTNMLIHTYGSSLLGFNNSVKIEYKPIRAPKGATDVIFRAVLKQPNGTDTPITLHLHLVDGHWKAYDGSVGSLSFVTNYRGQFSSYIRRHGLEKTIEELERRYNPPSGS